MLKISGNSSRSPLPIIVPLICSILLTVSCLGHSCMPSFADQHVLWRFYLHHLFLCQDCFAPLDRMFQGLGRGCLIGLGRTRHRSLLIPIPPKPVYSASVLAQPPYNTPPCPRISGDSSAISLAHVQNHGLKMKDSHSITRHHTVAIVAPTVTDVFIQILSTRNYRNPLLPNI